MNAVDRRVLPGFSLTLGFTSAYLGLIVLIPLAACFFKASTLGREEFFAAVWTPRAIAAYKLTFFSSFLAASINVVLGLLTSWTLVRYRFPLRSLLDALVDLPFALPTAVAGLIFAGLYVQDGWLGQFLTPLGIQAAYSRCGIVLVLVFTGFPFVVRTVQPILEGLDAEYEEAAAVLGANRLQTFRRVILPVLLPPTLTGFALAFARAIGEYGSVIFISSNMPYQSEIAPVLIVARLEEYSYGEAAAISAILLVASFFLLASINLSERLLQKN